MEKTHVENEMIVKRMKIIAETQEELTKVTEHYKDTLEADAVFQDEIKKEEKAKAEIKSTKEKKEQILEKATYKNYRDQIKELRQEIKELKDVLSQELADYYRDNGTLEVEDHEGNIKRMKFNVKLVS